MIMREEEYTVENLWSLVHNYYAAARTSSTGNQWFGRYRQVTTDSDGIQNTIRLPQVRYIYWTGNLGWIMAEAGSRLRKRDAFI